MSKEPEPQKPEKSGAELVLERILPEIEGLKKEFKEFRAQHSTTSSTPAQEPQAPSGGTTLVDNTEEQHREIKRLNPALRKCPDCYKPLPKLKPDSTNPAVRCSNCGTGTYLKASECPGCGATDNFEPLTD